MRTILTLVAMAAATGMRAQTGSRIGEIEAERDRKEEQLAPETPARLERRLNWVKESGILERFNEGYGGLRVKVGGMVSGSGLAVGPEYSRDGLLGGRLNLRAGAQTSTRGYQKMDTLLTAPRFLNDRITLDFYAVRHNYPGLNFYGVGAGSNRGGRSNFRLEDAAFDASLTVRVAKRLAAGGTAGYLLNNVGPGTDSRFISSERVYRAPGIDQQANFSRFSGFVQYDYRDYAPGPRAGGNYFAQFHQFGDRTLGRHGFQRLDLEAQQYVPFFNRRRVIALRAKTAMTFTDAGQTIPFYMQPTLGGQDDLRGFRPFRFRDNNLMVMNAEYRWEVFSGLDMAIFADAGKVAARRADLNFRRLESNAGFGFRFNARNNVFLRLDFGFSHEGFQVAFKFNNVFRKGPSRTSSTMGDF
jgi:outer membrane protein assembly factor BamA